MGKAGRKPLDDLAALQCMALALESGGEKYRTKAALHCASLTTGASPNAIKERLRMKFRQHEAALRRWAQEELDRTADREQPEPPNLAHVPRFSLAKLDQFPLTKITNDRPRRRRPPRTVTEDDLRRALAAPGKRRVRGPKKRPKRTR